jgi:hypothetical protein
MTVDNRVSLSTEREYRLNSETLFKVITKIANAKNVDYDAAEAIKELLKQGPREAKKDLIDWEVKEFKGENVLFYKGKNYVPVNAEL